MPLYIRYRPLENNDVHGGNSWAMHEYLELPFSRENNGVTYTYDYKDGTYEVGFILDGLVNVAKHLEIYIKALTNKNCRIIDIHD